MALTEDELGRRMERFSEAFRKSGTRLTHQRLEVFKEVASSEEHPDAEAVYRKVRERVPTISLDTVYRTLWLLEDLGLLTRMGPKGSTRFDANLRAHHHFVCEMCGRVRDFESDKYENLEVPPEVRRLGSVSRVNVEVKGLCKDCKAEGRTAPGPGRREAR